jgi:hypothetical protein
MIFRCPSSRLFVVAASLGCASLAYAQTPAPQPDQTPKEQEPQKQVPKVVPIPPLFPAKPFKEPTSPPARDVADPRDHLTLHLPAAWNLTRKDGEISTFHSDARSAPRNSQLRLVATLAFNPYPMSTFEGALFYVSSTPHSTAAACAAQTSTKPFESIPPATVDGQTFARGKDEHGQICTEARDVAYTALRGNSCLRFDLAINNFCGGDVSGAYDLTADQMQAIYTRLQTILKSVHFDK